MLLYLLWLALKGFSDMAAMSLATLSSEMNLFLGKLELDNSTSSNEGACPRFLCEMELAL
jgi:hypothetical protein